MMTRRIMSLLTIISCVFVLAILCCFPCETQSAGSQEPAPTLLWKEKDDYIKWINYHISVDDHLTIEELKELVCRTLKGEDLDSFKYVRVFVFHSAAGYTRLSDDAELAKKQIASYFWNPELLDRDEAWQLTAYADSDGTVYPREERPHVRFDHRTQCDR